MKHVVFEGRMYKVPDWVKYIARDADGSVWGYKDKPDRDCIYYDYSGSHKSDTYIQLSDACNDWYKSLREI